MERAVLTKEDIKNAINKFDFGDDIILSGYRFSNDSYNALFYELKIRYDNLFDVKFNGSGTYIDNTVFVIFYKCHFEKDINVPVGKADFVNSFCTLSISTIYMNDCIFDAFPMVCPEEGEFIGYKSLLISNKKYRYGSNTNSHVIGKILIPADAKRSSAFSKKCRCSKAKLLELYSLDDMKPFVLGRGDTLHSEYATYFTYEIGKEVCSDSWDDNRWNECSNGIHFFMNYNEAVEYANFYK